VPRRRNERKAGKCTISRRAGTILHEGGPVPCRVVHVSVRLLVGVGTEASQPWPSNKMPVTGAYLKAAVDALLAGNAPSAEQKPSIGCNIKWKR
jgi:hypothetical protein